MKTIEQLENEIQRLCKILKKCQWKTEYDDYRCQLNCSPSFESENGRYYYGYDGSQILHDPKCPVFTVNGQVKLYEEWSPK